MMARARQRRDVLKARLKEIGAISPAKSHMENENMQSQAAHTASGDEVMEKQFCRLLTGIFVKLYAFVLSRLMVFKLL